MTAFEGFWLGSYRDIVVLYGAESRPDDAGRIDRILDAWKEITRGPNPVEEMFELLEEYEAVEREQRRLAAERSRVLARMIALMGPSRDQLSDEFPTGMQAGHDYRSLKAEVANAVHQSEHGAGRQLDLAFRLTRAFPMVLGSLSDGEISDRHSQVIVDEGNVLQLDDSEAATQRRETYSERVLEYAVRMTPSQLRPIARRIAEELTETSLEERHEDALERRQVWVHDVADGMSELYALIPAVEAHAIYDRLTSMAKAVAKTERDYPIEIPRRRMDQLRADLMTDLVITGTPKLDDTLEHIHAQVHVITVPGSLSELNGYGPIDNLTAGRVTEKAKHWNITTLHPENGKVLSVDRYRPSEEMRRFIEARDETCRFPGCRVSASRCDLDHTVAASRGGPTSTVNMAALCRGHHVLKHHSKWKVKQTSSGVLEWTSPAGREYVERPATVRFLPIRNEKDPPDPDGELPTDTGPRPEEPPPF